MNSRPLTHLPVLPLPEIAQQTKKDSTGKVESESLKNESPLPVAATPPSPLISEGNSFHSPSLSSISADESNSELNVGSASDPKKDISDVPTPSDEIDPSILLARMVGSDINTDPSQKELDRSTEHSLLTTTPSALSESTQEEEWDYVEESDSAESYTYSDEEGAL